MKQSFKCLLFFISVIILIGCESFTNTPSAKPELLTTDSTNIDSSVLGLENNHHILLNKQQIKDRIFISHGNIPTIEGLFYIDQNNTTIHIIDPKYHKGHFDYANHAFLLNADYDQFVQNVEQPQHRKYFPFTLYMISDNAESNFSDNVSWVFQIRRYHFKDNDTQLFTQTKQWMDLLAIKLFNANPGKLMLYEGRHPYRKPNDSHKVLIDQLNIQSIAQNEMLLLAKAEQISVLNGKVACGYLKHNNIKKPLYSKNDIVIFDDVPFHIEPLAGVITLSAQTPLSHLNLLLKNRGTLNVSMSQKKHAEIFSDHINQSYPVKITANQHANPVLRIEKISKHQLDNCQQKVTALTLPKINQYEMTLDELNLNASIIDLNSNMQDAKIFSKQIIGSKSNQYALLLAQNNTEHYLMTKPALALDFSLYLYLAKQKSVQAELLNLQQLRQNNDEHSKILINAQLKKIRTAIKSINLLNSKHHTHENHHFLETLHQQLKAKFKFAKRVRFRSSTNIEDLADFNGAGLYESKGVNLDGNLEKMQKQLLKVMSSLWSERAYWERDYYGLNQDLNNIAMGILINESFANEQANGVLLISKPREGKSEFIQYRAIINSQIDDYAVVDAQQSNQVESFELYKLKNKNWALRDFDLIQNSNLGSVFLKNSDELQDARSELLNKMLNQAVISYEALLQSEQKSSTQYAADLEFKIMNEIINAKNVERIYIKQIRLIKNQ